MQNFLQSVLLKIEQAAGDFVFWIWDRLDPTEPTWDWSEDEELL